MKQDQPNHGPARTGAAIAMALLLAGLGFAGDPSTKEEPKKAKLVCPTRDEGSPNCLESLTRYANSVEGVSVRDASDEGGLRVSGTASSLKHIVDFLSEINACPVFTEVRLARVTVMESGDYEFVLEGPCKLDKSEGR